MKINDIEFDEQKAATPDLLSHMERRSFLKLGLAVTGVLAGGSILSLSSVVNTVFASPAAHAAKYPYKPHYSMLIYQNRCIDCERCIDACTKTNHVPSYGYRTAILEREAPQGGDVKREFIPVLCNQCNRPPCVRGCPTKATYKDEKTGIVMMTYDKCIGCKTCIAACPYNARYYNEERKSVDKCNFCIDTRLSKGLTTTACVEACPAGARVFGDLSDPKSEVYRMVHQIEKTIWVHRPEVGAAPNVFYSRG
ncbi:MAG TPA: 4Fe-4S dicluster domain-containing protein [Dissulfurispiraceae bacterium]|nr:4Fe-4S dicluster domain-containing protein [Dissulfurispiraceae bacterium]